MEKGFNLKIETLFKYVLRKILKDILDYTVLKVVIT